jgi:hypothetical protein
MTGSNAHDSGGSIWKPRCQTSAVTGDCRAHMASTKHPDHWSFPVWRVYAPSTVSMAKKEQCNRASRPQGLDAHVTLICGSPVPELFDMDVVPRRRAEPVIDHQAQRLSCASHHLLLLKTTQPRNNPAPKQRLSATGLPLVHQIIRNTIIVYQIILYRIMCRKTTEVKDTRESPGK